MRLDYLALDRGNDSAELAPRRRQRGSADRAIFPQGSMQAPSLPVVQQTKPRRKSRSTTIPPPAATPSLDGVPEVGAPLHANSHVVERDLAKLDQHQCSCYELNQLAVDDIRQLCIARNISTTDEDGKPLKKKDLLLEACPMCLTAEQVDAALQGANLRQGVPDEYWQWNPGVAPYSLMSAFHLALVRTAQQPANAAFANDLQDFRAHVLRMMHVNYTFYVTHGKVNRSDGPGQHRNVPPMARAGHFMMSCHAALNHYDNIHDHQTCGRLRKNQACAPFREFAQCPDNVRLVVRHYVNQTIFCVSESPLTPIDQQYPDQELLRQRFGL